MRSVRKQNGHWKITLKISAFFFIQDWSNVGKNGLNTSITLQLCFNVFEVLLFAYLVEIFSMPLYLSGLQDLVLTVSLLKYNCFF